MHTTQNSPQVITAGPVTWQTVNPGITVSPVTSNEPAQRGGASGRICSSAFQAILGVLLIIFGIIAISLVVPDTPSISNYRRRLIDLRDRRSWGIWCGAIFFLTSVCGFSSKKNQALISLYMVFSILASLLAFCGIIAASIQLATVSGAKRDVESYDPFSHNSFSNYYNFNGYQQLNRVKRILSVHLACYAIMLTCFVGEFIVSIIGAAFTCSGLDCCSNQRVIYYQTQVPQFPGQPVLYPPSQQYPVGVPLPAGTSMVQTTSNVVQGSMATQFTPHNRYVAAPPPPYQPEISPQDSTSKEMRIRRLPLAPPTYESPMDTQRTQGNSTTQDSQGHQGSNDADYLEVIE